MNVTSGSAGSDPFPAGGGDAGAAVRHADWRATAAGPPDSWTPALRAAVSLALEARSPMLVCWGERQATIANDAWRRVAGAAPRPGRPGGDAWPAIWPTIGPLVVQARRSGEGADTDDVSLTVDRDGARAAAFFRFSVSPIRADGGGILGALCTATETTDRRRLRDDADHLRFALDAADAGAWSWDCRSDRMTLAGPLAAHLGLSDGATLTPRDFCARFVAAPDRFAVEAALETARAGRRDVSAEFRLVHADGTCRWTTAQARLHGSPDGAASLTGILLDIDGRRQAEQRQDALMAELDHRVKNTLLMIQSMARQSIKGDGGTIDTFVSRLTALAGIHTLLAENRWSGTALAAVVDRVVAVAGAEPGRRVAATGPPVALDPAAAQTLGLVLHELAINAIAHGSLSSPGGTVAVAWRIRDGQVTLDWRESGGPATTETSDGGFGRVLLERMLEHDLGGRATRRFAPDGLAATLCFPADRAARTGRAAPAEDGPADSPVPVRGSEAAAADPIDGRRILVVEDSFLVAMAMEEQLARAGAEVIGPVGRLDEAVDTAERERIDAALLDVNLNGDMIWPVAEVLARRGVPFAFVTGYQASALRPEWRESPRLTKPADEERLIAMVESLLKPAPP